MAKPIIERDDWVADFINSLCLRPVWREPYVAPEPKDVVLGYDQDEFNSDLFEFIDAMEFIGHSDEEISFLMMGFTAGWIKRNG